MNLKFLQEHKPREEESCESHGPMIWADGNVALSLFEKPYTVCSHTRREFLREILCKNIAIIAIQHSEMYFVDNFGEFSHTVKWNSLKSVW